MNTSMPRSDSIPGIGAIEPWLNALAIFILATIFLSWDASRGVYVLLSLAALVILIKLRPPMPRDFWLYAWPIIAYVGAAILSVFFNEVTDSAINRIVSRFFLLLLAVPLAGLFCLGYDPKRNIWIGFAIGCIVLGLIAFVETLILDVARARGGYNAAVFGSIALAMTSIVIASYHRLSRMKFGKSLFAGAILMGVCAMLLSGTRTSWIAGIAVLILAMNFYLDRYSLFRRALITLGLIVVIGLAGSTLPIAQKRIEYMIDYITPYVTDAEQPPLNSLSMRVELWKAGWQMGMQDKLFGYGPGITKRKIKNHVKQNPHLRVLMNLSHLHNQFVQSFAMTGLVGLLSLLALFCCHFYLCIKYLGKRYIREVRCLALAGLLLLVIYLIKSIPGVPFFGKYYLMMYGLTSAIIFGSLFGALRESPGASATDGRQDT